VRREDYRATLILMVGLGLATLTGFAREAALAHQLGAGRATDVYLIAFAIPELVLIALPIVLSPAFLPLFADLRLRVGERGAWRFGLRVAGALLALLLGITALVALSAPLYLRWLAPGFEPAERVQATRAVVVMVPAISLMGCATLVGAALQVYRRFARPALATAIYNLTFVAVLFGAPLAWSVDRAAWGVTLGAAAALLIQLSLLWRYRPSASAGGKAAHDPQPPVGVKDVARLAGPLAAGYAVHHAILLVDRAMATTLAAGSVATLNYAYRLALVVGQVSGLAVSTALFPGMAEQAASDDRAGLRASLAGALRFVWAVGLPASCGLVLLRTPLVQVLFERGAFDRAATAAVSDVLVWYALAVLADAMCQPLWRVVYARRSMWTVLAVNSLQTAVRVMCNVALIGPLGYNGLALSAAVGLSIQAVVLALWVRRHLGDYLSKEWWRNATRVVLATALALIAAGVMVRWLSALSPLVVLLASGFLGSLIYLTTLRFLGKWMP
jgi:putative peptidoglycan lipid II flippase